LNASRNQKRLDLDRRGVGCIGGLDRLACSADDPVRRTSGAFFRIPALLPDVEGRERIYGIFRYYHTAFV